MESFSKFLGIISIVSLLFSVVSPPEPAMAAIEAADYFTVTADSATADAGGTVTFTISSLTTGGVANPLEGADFAYVEIHNPVGFGPGDADIFAIGGDATIKASQATPWGGTTAANVGGSNDTIVAVNFAGASVGTVTVTARNNDFDLFVWAPGAGINGPDDGGVPAGQDFRSVDVTAVAGIPEKLVASSVVNSAELAQEITYVITQVNAGGGTDITALADVGVSVDVDGTGEATITKVNGVAVEVPGTSVANMTLTNGVGTVTVVVSALGDGNGTVTVTPSSATLPGMDTVDSSVVVGAVIPLKIQGYGPPNGQAGMPTNAPVDVMFNEDPDPLDTIFPLTNTADSVLSITAGGVAATGQWRMFADTWGDSTFYRASFQASSPLAASTLYTISIKKSLVSVVDLPGGMPALTDGDLAYSFTITTGAGGGNFVAPVAGGEGAGGFGGGFEGTFGGEFPPMAHLSYPMPGMPNIPTNISCVTVGFDRAMDSSTLTTSNIYIKKLTGGVESDPAGSPAITALQGNEGVCIGGYTFEANTDYRVVVTRDVRDSKGTQLAGMPESNGETIGGFGFGFSSMGPFREQFKTGAGAAAAIAPSLMGLNINQYKSGASITGVPTGMSIRASFNEPLNPSTVTSANVTLKRNGTVPEAGSVFYDAMGSTIEFVPTSALSASTSYTFALSTSVKSVTGTSIAALSSTFTTGVADVVKPKLAFVDADNYGLRLQFDEALNDDTATNRSFYTLKTCSQATIAADGASCTGGGAVSTVSLLTGVNAHYDRAGNNVWMEGLTLTAGDGFYVGVGTGVTDVAGNGIHATDDKSWTGVVQGADKFAGGQGMFTMGTIGMEDFDMGMMGMKPINAMPMNTMAGATTKYFIDIPIGTLVPAGGYIELTFPTGFVVTGVKRDAQSPMNSDFNGPGTGTVTFAANLPTITGLTDGGGAQANDGVGYITAARKVVIKLSAATQADDFLHIDLDGITNSSEPKSFDTSGYSIDIKTYNTSSVLLEAMTTMPFFISSAGTGSVSGQVKSGDTGLNGVKVFLGSPMTGPMEITTSNDGAGTLVAGSNDGEYKFENLPAGQYFVFTEPMFTSGITDYYGSMMPEPLMVSGAATKNISVSAATAIGKATLPVTITFPNLDAVASLGFNDSIDIFAFNPSSRMPVIKTVSRGSLGASPYSVNLFLPSAGDWNVGIGPAMPKGPMGGGMGMGGGWMPSQNMNVVVAAADLGGADLPAVALSIGVSDKTITGKVLDNSGTAVANAEVYAYDPQAGKSAHTTATTDGSFTLNVNDGSYKVGAFLPGLPSSQETPVLVSGASFYVNGSTTASTGSAAGNPFNLKVVMPDYTIQGRVATGASPISGAAIWAHRTDAPSPPIQAVTDSSGNYTLYVGAGTWKVEGDAPTYGYLGSKTLTVSTASLSNQNFEVSSDLNTVAGTINIPGTSDDSGTIVYAYGPNGSAEAKTATDGTYTLNLPDGTYDLGAVIPGTGDLAPLADVVVDGAEVGKDFAVETPRTFTVTLSEAVTEDTIVKFFDDNGAGNELLIPDGSTSGTIVLPQGTYYLDADVPGAGFEDLGIVGAEFNNPNGTPVVTDQVNVDGAGDAITITLPAMFTVTGQVAVGATGLNDVFVSVYNQSTKEYFGAVTANNAAGGGLDGEYSIKLQAGTYTFSADKSGYSSAPFDLAVAANSADNDFSLTASSRTIAGTVMVGGVAIANASVWAEQAGGGFAATEASTDGTYVLNVDPGTWTVNAIADGYSAGTSLNVDVTSTSATSKNFTLVALAEADALQDPTTESMTPGSGGTIFDENTNAEVVVPQNALGTSTEAGQMSISETNEIIPTASTNPLGNGYEISATDSEGNPITVLDDDVEVTLRLTLAELVLEGVDTPAEASGVANGYWDDTAANWVSLPTNFIYYDALGAVIPENTVASFGTLALASVDYIEFVSEVDHFTTFAPILAVGATPPATPAGLAAVAASGQVTLTWTKNAEADMSTYNIWEANVTEGILTTATQASCGVATCSKEISGLTNGTAYSFQLGAVDSDGNVSAYSAAVSSTPAAAAVASTPGGSLTTLTGGGGGGGSSSNNDTAVTEEVTGETEALADAATAGGATPFVDITDHWAKSYIENLYEAKVVSGFDASHFNPNANVTRAELIKMVVNAFELPIPSVLSDNLFGDVEEASWYASFVAAAKKSGLVGGYADNTFKPAANINRAEAVKILVTALGADLSVVAAADFEDVKSGAWYYKYVAYAAEHGIVNGYADGSFGPENNLTRAEAAKIISLILDEKLGKGMVEIVQSML